MPNVISVTDQHQVVPTAKFPHAKFPFPNFNVVQSRLFEFYDRDANALVAAATSAGKTVCAEMFISHEVRARGGKGMYLSPLKALAEEKKTDWAEDGHHFSDLNLSVCTGDYQLTADRRAELEAADVVIMSSEMLNSRCRNHKAENNTWLNQVGTLVVDEAHLLTVEGRGDHLESGLVKFAQMCPQARIVLLSATLPNVDEISRWISKLTNKDTHLLVSEYRPVPLGIHYVAYQHAFRYAQGEENKVEAALRVVLDHPDDKFVIFSHTKDTQKKMESALIEHGIECEVHNANLEKKKRIEAEKRFRTDPKLRVVVATSTLAWGVNMPARRVIILGVHRGMSEVPKYDIDQMMGRAGRPQYDKAGDVYILLPEKGFGDQKRRLQTPHHIQSQLFDPAKPQNYKTLGFHLVSEIHHGNVETRADIEKWYSHTLAAFQQKQLAPGFIDSVLQSLERAGAIKQEGDRYVATACGRVASMFYYSPYDVADLQRNFSSYFREGVENDLLLSLAMGSVDTWGSGILSNAEAEAMENYIVALMRLGRVPGNWKDVSGLKGKIKAGYCYNQLLCGESDRVLYGTIAGLRADSGRLIQVLQALDSMASRWGREDYFRGLQKRINYGVGGELLDLIGIEGVGSVKARKLAAFGLKTPADVAANRMLVQRALACSGPVADKIVEAARKVAGGKG